MAGRGKRRCGPLLCDRPRGRGCDPVHFREPLARDGPKVGAGREVRAVRVLPCDSWTARAENLRCLVPKRTGRGANECSRLRAFVRVGSTIRTVWDPA
jgi:hypothetical protein